MGGSRTSTYLLPLAILCAPAASAGQPGSGSPVRLDTRVALFDATQGATLWARGATYKAGFDEQGTQYVPFLGSNAPDNFPIRFAPRALRLGGEELVFDTEVRPHLEGSIVSFERGAFVEVYHVEADALEQTFRFDRLPHAGELQLTIGIESVLAPYADAAGIRFDGPHGGARFGKAIAFDAAGHSVAAPVTLAEGAIEIRVPAEFLARASAPITIDPWITTLAIDVSPAEDANPDVAYDASLDVYVVCYERRFSASDRDVHGKVLDASGNLLAEFLIDASPTLSTLPRVASLSALGRFLVAVRRHQSGGFRNVDSRIVHFVGGQVTIDPPVQLYGYGNATSLDLGGDRGATPPFRFCLIVGEYGLGCSRVFYRIVDENGLPVGALAELGDNCDDPQYDEPRIAKSATLALTGPRSWPVLLEYIPYLQPHGLRSLRVYADGTWGEERIVSTSATARSEAVSSPLEGAADVLPFVALWRSGHGMFARAVHGASLGPVVQVGPPELEVIGGAIDSDGSSIVVAYTERTTPGVDERVHAASYVLDGLEPVLTERVLLSPNGGREGASAVTSTRSGGGASERFLAVWHDLADPQDGDVEGALYDTPGTGRRHCTAAPNSVGPGATLHAAGSISIELDEFALSVIGCPPNRPGLFYLGLGEIELPFGDGFRCIGGATRRIAPIVTTDAGGAAALLLDFDQPYGDLVQPGTPGVNYQFWYRDPAGGPATFNSSDALNVDHTP